MIESTCCAFSLIDDIQSSNLTRPSTPTTPLLVLTPVNKAVPAAAESGTFLFVEYVYARKFKSFALIILSARM